MKKILFFSILLSLIFSIYPEIVNPDKPLQGDWDLKAQKKGRFLVMGRSLWQPQV